MNTVLTDKKVRNYRAKDRAWQQLIGLYKTAEHHEIAVIWRRGWEAVPYATENELTELGEEYQGTALGITEEDMETLEEDYHQSGPPAPKTTVTVIEDDDTEEPRPAPEPET
ncbi:hypothetical protein ColTof4_13545 [Colletotrichum tofieldiae]|nr:hypothetical protein ColTof3_14496 [Colletotrichum tofieldiae]GKT81122.1 hypothetical protein ColTof4_13545 [Colletotrichum tofieldiae]